MKGKTKIALVSTFLAGLVTCHQVDVHLPSCYTEDERRQGAFSCVSLRAHCVTDRLTSNGIECFINFIKLIKNNYIFIFSFPNNSHLYLQKK